MSSSNLVDGFSASRDLRDLSQNLRQVLSLRRIRGRRRKKLLVLEAYSPRESSEPARGLRLLGDVAHCGVFRSVEAEELIDASFHLRKLSWSVDT